VVFRELEDGHGEVNALANIGWVHHYRGDHAAALRDLSSAFEFYQRTGADRNAAITLRGIALAETELGAYEDSLAHATEALGMFEQQGLLLDAAMALNCLGWTNFRSGRHEQAASAYRRAAEAGERGGGRRSRCGTTVLGRRAAAVPGPEHDHRRRVEGPPGRGRAGREWTVGALTHRAGHGRSAG
jgi:tetratricopeptide (TPR) repeat protein